ncbi:11089_t:CDS:1, partial [Entrophospora sp. SA101]
SELSGQNPRDQHQKYPHHTPQKAETLPIVIPWIKDLPFGK